MSLHGRDLGNVIFLTIRDEFGDLASTCLLWVVTRECEGCIGA
jgi:hypothetical protein